MSRAKTGTVLLFAFLLHSPASADEPQLAHMVFFTLAESTDDHRKQLVDACHKYLTNHEGTIYFSAGERAKEFDRQVNDLEFDVALHIVFANKAAHDSYQSHPRHLKFIADHKNLWRKVRVFDSYVRVE